MQSSYVTDKKQEHVNFVSNLNGTSILENYHLITLPILLNTCVSFWTINLFQLGFGDLSGIKWINFMAVVMPYILSITVFSDYLSEISQFVITLIVMGGVNSALLSKSSKYWPRLRLTVHDIGRNRVSLLVISQLRGWILLCTSICILAVDVHIFPRRFAKTETYGFGPMDLGVGLFTLIFGVVEITRPAGRHKHVKSIGILLFLALVRFFSIKLSDYHERETEYGRHWNFFLTLAVVRLISAIVGDKANNWVVLGGMIATVTALQHCLMHGSGLEMVCISNNRGTGLLQANKEGVISIVGYALLWLLGRCIGLAMQKGSVVTSIVVTGGALLAPLTVILMNLSPSRRCANLAYVIWTGGSLCWGLGAFMLANVAYNWLEDRANYVAEKKNPDLFCVTNRFGLLHFVVANLLTGAINYVFNTVTFSPIVSLAVLSVYMVLAIFVPHYIGLFISMIYRRRCCKL